MNSRWHVFTIWAYRILPAWLTKMAIFMLKKKYVLGVVGVVQNEAGQVLFLHHTYRKQHAWRMPGGLKERGETPFSTIIRELDEEANMTVEPITILDLHEADFTLDVIVHCRLMETRVFQSNAEVDDWCWVDPDHPPFYLRPEDVAVFQKLNVVCDATTT